MSSRRRFWRVAVGTIVVAVTVTQVFAEDPDFTLGSKKMAARIDAILSAQNPMQNPFRSVERAEMLKGIAARTAKEAPNSVEHVSSESQLALELLRAGEM